MVAHADIGDHGHAAAVKGQTFAQHAAAGGFEHGRIHMGVHKHIARTARAAAVAAVDLARLHIHAVGVGHAHAQAVGAQQVRGEPHGGGFAVGAGDGNHRNAAVIARRIQHRHDGFAHIAAFAIRGLQMHAQSRCRVDFDHAAALGFQRAQHRFANNVHAANIEPHHLSGCNGAGCHLRVHVVGHIGGGAAGGEVGVVAQNHAHAFAGHRLGVQALLFEPGQRHVVKTNFGQRGGVALTAPWVGIDPLDQLAHRVLAVSNHQGRFAACGCHQFVTDHQ